MNFQRTNEMTNLHCINANKIYHHVFTNEKASLKTKMYAFTNKIKRGYAL